MRLWKRRQVIYDWDNNYSPRTDYIEGAPNVEPFDWHCPDDAYIRLVTMHFKYTTADVAHASSLQSELWHANHRYFQDCILGTVGKNATYYITLCPNITPTTAGLPSIGFHFPLPQPTLLLPGYFIRIVQTNPIAGDAIHDVVVHYHRYNLR